MSDFHINYDKGFTADSDALFDKDNQPKFKVGDLASMCFCFHFLSDKEKVKVYSRQNHIPSELYNYPIVKIRIERDYYCYLTMYITVDDRKESDTGSSKMNEVVYTENFINTVKEIGKEFINTLDALKNVSDDEVRNYLDEGFKHDPNLEEAKKEAKRRK